MARGTQHRKRRPTANAGPGGVATPPQARPHKPKPPQWQEQLFFARLRSHARWAYALLAVLFLLTFALLGIGSGSNGISDALSSAFHFGSSSSGGDVAKLQSNADAHPTSTKAWRDLATALEQKSRPAEAVTALQHLATLQPKDTDVLRELAGQQTQLAQQYSTEASTAASVGGLVTSASDFQPASTTPLGQSLTALSDPITSAVQSVASSRQSGAQTKLTTAQHATLATYEQLAKLAPKDANTQLQLGQAASSSSDYPTAIKAYTAFLKLVPGDPFAPQVKKVLKALRATTTPTSTKR